MLLLENDLHFWRIEWIWERGPNNLKLKKKKKKQAFDILYIMPRMYKGHSKNTLA